MHREALMCVFEGQERTGMIADIKNVLGIAVEDVREFIRYDIENLDESILCKRQDDDFQRSSRRRLV